jgi:hypothetical protein
LIASSVRCESTRRSMPLRHANRHRGFVIGPALDDTFVARNRQHRGDVHVRQATVTGDEDGDRTADGLWPSNHAGTVAAIQFRR